MSVDLLVDGVVASRAQLRRDRPDVCAAYRSWVIVRRARLGSK